MKSYITRIELEESNPLIWRRVIMPAGATYKRLHDVIQEETQRKETQRDGSFVLTLLLPYVKVSLR